jgi:glycine/D-amino acid oxidase-like deaminating enzyme
VGVGHTHTRAHDTFNKLILNHTFFIYFRYPPGEVHADDSRVAAAANAFTDMSPTLAAQLQVKQVQACMRPCAPDALPLMGKINHVKGAYISAGHNCWGILWAPSSGKALAELIMHGSSTLNLAAFNPHRFQPKSGLSGHSKRGRHMGAEEVGEQW